MHTKLYSFKSQFKMSEKLSEFYIKKAKSELNETESRKKQSLEIVRNWLLKHPFIKFNKPDLINMDFLLPYFRARKYNLNDRFYELLENTLVTVKRKPNWCNFYGEGLERALELYDTGFMIVSKEFDSDGRRAVICSHNIEGNKFNGDDALRLISLVVSFICQEEESQIAGITYINDTHNFSMRYLGVLTIKNCYEGVTTASATPIRLKKIFAVGLPAIVTQIHNILKSAMSEKMRKRVFLLHTNDELAKHMDVSILPKEYGGKFSKAELLEYFKPKLIEHAEIITNIHKNFDVDLQQAHKTYNFEDTELTGSFRKLEVD